jgi:hypothetical protein
MKTLRKRVKELERKVADLEKQQPKELKGIFKAPTGLFVGEPADRDANDLIEKHDKDIKAGILS